MTTADDDPAVLLRPSWDLYRDLARNPHVSAARQQATVWALDELERRIGQDCLQRYWKAAGHVPAEVNLGSAHVSALGNLLDFALRRTLKMTADGTALCNLR